MDKVKAMRQSRVLKKLREGRIASCVKLNIADSRPVEIAAMAGFDCIWTDMEHVANDWSVIEKQVMAAKAYDADLMVRVSRGGYSDYIRPLELDATIIMVPHLMSLEDARRVVRMTKFHPVGRRPVDSGNADGAYCTIPFNDYIEQANRERLLVVQIEDPEPLDELDAIAALDGIDMLFFGPADFSQGLGVPGDFTDPRISEAKKRIADTAVKHGKFAGTVGGLGSLEELAGLGYSFISIGADVLALHMYFSDIVSGYSKILKERYE